MSQKQAVEDSMARTAISDADRFAKATLKGLAHWVERRGHHRAAIKYAGGSRATLTVVPDADTTKSKSTANETAWEVGNSAIETSSNVTTVSSHQNDDGSPSFDIILGKPVSGIVSRIAYSVTGYGYLVTLGEDPRRDYAYEWRPSLRVVHAIMMENIPPHEQIPIAMTAPGDRVTIVYPKHDEGKPVLINESTSQLRILDAVPWPSLSSS